MGLIFTVIAAAFIILFIFAFIHTAIWWIKQENEIREKRKQWKKDKNLPLTVVEATIVAKRERECLQTRVTRKSATFIAYRATFEFENGERKEFSVSFPEYGMIAEGDAVELSFQGAKYIMLEKRRF